MGLLCLVISSCVSQQVTATTSPTETTYVLEKDGIFATHTDRWRFYEWRLSFTLPSQWLAKDLPPDYFNPYKVEHFADTNGSGDNWIFCSESIENETGGRSAAEIRFRFKRIHQGLAPTDFSDAEWEN